MLSVLFAESCDNLAHLVRFYAPHADRLLDVTYGNGTLSKRVGIPVVGVDKDPDTNPTIRGDARNLPLDDASFHAACYDPPYLYGAKAMHMGPIGTKTWSNVRSTWKSPADLIDLSQGVARELRRVLSAEGVVIVKIMDSRYKGRLERNHEHVIRCFEGAGFVMHDLIVYLRTVTGSFVNNKSAQSAHGYFLIFKQPSIKRAAKVLQMPEAA